MGFFSWITQDSGKSIPSRFSKQKTFAVTMRSPTVDYLEDNYEGYGIFGGKDYYELLAEMNPQLTLELTNNPPKRLQKGLLKLGDPTELRHVGIHMSSQAGNWIALERLLYPQLIENPTVEVDFHDRVADCPYQGFFYPEQ